MEKNFQAEEGISLLDVAKLLLGKIKLLILVVLIGGIVGASFAVVTTRKVDYYGTEVSFYVNPKKAGENDSESQYGVYGAYGKHVMDNMVKLLNSEIFTELLILNGETLPVASEWADKDNAEELANLEKLISEAKTAQDKASAVQLEADNALVRLQGLWTSAMQDNKDYKTVAYSKASYDKVVLGNEDKYSTKLVEAYKEYEGDKAFDIQTAWKDVVKNIAEYKDILYTKEIYDKAVEKYPEIRDNLSSAFKSYEGLKMQALDVQNFSASETEEALEAWRQTDKYKKDSTAYGKAISFSYLKETDSGSTSDLARSFIYAKIEVLRDEAFANKLLEVIKVVVPEYVKENMAIPSGYESTNCRRVTTLNQIELTNPNYTRNQAIKYGILLAGVSFVVACALIIFIDRADKRLRDYNAITKEFGVPVLGVIPSIHYLEEQSEKSNKEDNK